MNSCKYNVNSRAQNSNTQFVRQLPLSTEEKKDKKKECNEVEKEVKTNIYMVESQSLYDCNQLRYVQSARGESLIVLNVMSIIDRSKGRKRAPVYDHSDISQSAFNEAVYLLQHVTHNQFLQSSDTIIYASLDSQIDVRSLDRYTFILSDTKIPSYSQICRLLHIILFRQMIKFLRYMCVCVYHVELQMIYPSIKLASLARSSRGEKKRRRSDLSREPHQIRSLKYARCVRYCACTRACLVRVCVSRVSLRVYTAGQSEQAYFPGKCT